MLEQGTETGFRFTPEDVLRLRKLFSWCSWVNNSQIAVDSALAA
jgi:hypothetical protein